MGLREEIEPFWEGDGLIAPYPNPTHEFRTCDNGTMFLSEYYIMLRKNNLLTPDDATDFKNKIKACYVEGSPGLVARAPGDRGDEAPDDMYGVLAACVVLNIWDLGQAILNWGLTHRGSFNTRNPEIWTKESFLWRQPQLLCAAYCASGSTPFYMWPLFGVTAAIIATSCIGADKGDADSRRLSWLLIQAVSPFSWACRQAAKIWMKRLYATYPNGMLDVAQLYFSPGPPEHPFRKYFVT